MLPPRIAKQMRLPIIAAPMFIVSTPKLVIETCRAGVIGSFPTLNARTSENLDSWFNEIKTSLQESSSLVAPYAANLIVHHSNKSMMEHLSLIVKHKVPIVITSLGAAKQVYEAVHSYSGIVLHDVTNIHHANKAIAAGADGLIAVCSGAGGHAGITSVNALVPALRARFKDTLIVAGGAISNGATVRAMQTLGADVAYMGTRFIATQEANAPEEYKLMLVNGKEMGNLYSPTYLPIVYTDRISGVFANFLGESLRNAGVDPKLVEKAEVVEEDFSKLGILFITDLRWKIKGLEGCSFILILNNNYRYGLRDMEY